ncbi:hypothetical protein P152DRAFT_193415 [Eremomyces bilateralis CBS 781.70]|uniref:Uncharacterized protein n=1 Tax=Eremomyces bilateralis CBS 781.70 TaxID=1392243 RepID=A0A6G1GC70_9PEZI|nr:uncharacterized protein P152DRAFT_193415 [Eremomyces bilateralis CBS 781.70]KAF1815698.1 hypothetical protein P152DRAFT_193415 [Eremomyces bilateralis CBS 781.70]
MHCLSLVKAHVQLLYLFCTRKSDGHGQKILLILLLFCAPSCVDRRQPLMFEAWLSLEVIIPWAVSGRCSSQNPHCWVEPERYRGSHRDDQGDLRSSLGKELRSGTMDAFVALLLSQLHYLRYLILGPNSAKQSVLLGYAP